jgi:putative transcriptional regulator
MKERGKTKKDLAGSLLLAHPAMRDPNFRRAVILISSHSDEGAMGVVINRPLGRKLGSINADFATGDLADVPIYGGGPVQTDQLIITAWRVSPEEGTFQLHFGIDPDKARELRSEGLQLGAFLGYSGWGKGQLEKELHQNTWVVLPVLGEQLMQGQQGDGLWSELMGGISPELRLLAEEPEDPSVN